MNTEDIITIVLFLIFMVIAIAASMAQNKKRGAILTAQAEKRNGEVRRTGLGRWELRLPVKGQTVLIYSVPGSRYSPPRTLAVLKSDTVMLPVIDITRNNISQKIMAAFGRERAITNDEDFDKEMVVRGEDQYMIQRLLTADLKQRLMSRSLRGLEVKIKPQEVRVTMLTIPANEEGFDEFIDTVLAILQNIL